MKSLFEALNSKFTYTTDPATVSRDTSEDGGFPQSVAARRGYEAGNSVDDILAADLAVQGATRVTLWS